ncbi:acyl-CoA oxidase [Aspergillus heteromorphus CBS 117.55]|uniref:Acyl-CoA oxidase n=1 Tax=Aspergillus heteromorphus CBS 117.55 TaxID=1448321 RepID=A0A317VDF4_9EURO|nr:acyl-CoA oxidase [Aspergillus heteromorphus CBS 117.55]PWY70922.1 acyl-CoA oxidase [Aspergillus heteromorphus CBS 117.55]
MPSSTVNLLSSDLFKHHYGSDPQGKHLERSYHRARAVARHWGLTLDDILSLTPRFWHAHTDGITLRDTVAHTIFTIHYNLVAGTIAPYALERPDLQPLMKQILHFDVVGGYMLNEVGHGCDARNIETTATWQSDGGFVLNTPSPNARKFMPPTIPVAGIPRIAIVFARLLVEGEDRGIRPFVVHINNGWQMRHGIRAWRLPVIASGRMLHHDLTSFSHVHLPSTALLGKIARPSNMRDQYLSSIHRLSVGAIVLSLWVIPFLKCAAYVVGKYSQHRTVQQGVRGERVPIITFRTQQLPITHALAEAAVLEPFADWIAAQHRSPSLSPATKHGLSVILKVIFLQNGRGSLSELIERSGAQGMFPDNELIKLESLTRIVGIAEGEVLVLSIRFATEMLLGRYSVPDAKKPGSLLAQHETGFIGELRKLRQSFKEHRGEDYNHYLLPQCRPMVLAIGQRMVYEAAVERGVDRDLLALYEAGAVKSDSSWYVEQLGLSRAAQFDRERQACDAVMAQLDRHLDGLDIEPYCTAPMLSASRWDRFLNSAPLYTGLGGSRAGR